MMTVVGTLLDGRTIAKATGGPTVYDAGMIYLTLTFSELRTIDAILNLIVTGTDPVTTAYGAQQPQVSGNVVGFTVQDLAVGSTVTWEGVALGH